jgi:hypothetical protein
VTVLLRASRATVRLRYIVLLVVALAFAHAGYVTSAHNPNDWVIFELGARSLVHWHGLSFYGGNPLHLYANNPAIQIGPPALLPVVATQWMSPHTVNVLFVVVMTVMGLAAIGCLEAAAARVTEATQLTRQRIVVLLAGLPIAAAWGYESGQFHHLDDTMALLCISVAVWFCASGRSAWLVGVALGLAVATKPWAVVAAPLLLGLPRQARANAILGLLGTAGIFWAPFVLAAPGTIRSLGLLHIVPESGSVLALLGVHGHVEHWLRPVQFGVGAAAASYVALRGRWAAAPLVGIAVRVAFDPYVYAYYGLGPVLAALAWDLLRPSQRRLPVWTAWTLFIEFGLRLVAPSSVCAVGRAVWVLTVLGVMITARRSEAEPAAESTAESAPEAAPAGLLVTA